MFPNFALVSNVRMDVNVTQNVDNHLKVDITVKRKKTMALLVLIMEIMGKAHVHGA